MVKTGDDDTFVRFDPVPNSEREPGNIRASDIVLYATEQPRICLNQIDRFPNLEHELHAEVRFLSFIELECFTEVGLSQRCES
jgi:hypothetical protein